MADKKQGMNVTIATNILQIFGFICDSQLAMS